MNLGLVLTDPKPGSLIATNQYFYVRAYCHMAPWSLEIFINDVQAVSVLRPDPKTITYRVQRPLAGLYKIQVNAMDPFGSMETKKVCLQVIKPQS